MDMLNVFGEVNDVSFYGWGQGGLEQFAESAAKAQGRKITEEPNPQDGLFFRSDQYDFDALLCICCCCYC